MEKSLLFALCKFFDNPVIYVADADVVRDLQEKVDYLTQENKRISALYAQEVQINLALEDKLCS